MIDWLTFVVPLSCFSGLKTGSVTSISPDGLVEWSTAKRLPLVGSYDQKMYLRPTTLDCLSALKRGEPGSAGGARAFARMAVVTGSLVEISGCPAKFLQGHNVFGSDSVCGLAAAVVRQACSSLGLEPSPIEMRSIEQGAFLLRRVDLTQSYSLASRSEVLAWIEAAEIFGRMANRGRRAKGRFASTKGGALCDRSTVSFGQGSQMFWLKFYAKGVELEAPKHGLPDSLLMREQLLEYAQPLLRCEVQLNRKQLERLNLRYGSSWLSVEPFSVWEDHMKSVSLVGDMAKSDGLLDSLPPKLRPIYMAWLNGVDMADAYPRATFYRHRKSLLAYGVDISVRQPFVDRTNVVPLRRVLEAVPVLEPPAWAVGTPLYFDPLAELARRAKR